MFPSRADRILSRYRPIAPKLPPPIPPSASLATTDLSSTGASPDSFLSSTKIRRTRKRRIAPATSFAAKCPKVPKSEQSQVVSTLSNNNAGISTSPLTRGNSDAAVPAGIDLSPTSAVQQSSTAAKPHRMMNVSDMSRVPVGEASMVAPPFHPYNLVEQARMFMVVDALKSRQPSLSPHPLHLIGCPGIMEKDVAFMERAAASSALPENGTPSSTVSCNPVCMKGVGHGYGQGHGGGGFTEMIRGITHLPTVADVQTLMQARCGTTVGVSSPTTESRLISPTRMELHVPASSHMMRARASSLHVEDGTLPLLPTYSSTHHLPTPILDAVSPASAPLAGLPVDHKHLLQGEGVGMHTSASSSAGKGPGYCRLGGRDLCELAIASRQSQEETGNGTEALSLSPLPLSASPLVPLTGSPIGASTLNCDDATVDHVYLQQAYGGSTDPILLVDDNCQALWFNKAYERAFKSVLDRSSSKPIATGPYIDPLGHPTPLGSLLLNKVGSSSRSMNATLWGFLKKLVMPSVDTTPNLLGGMKLEANNKEEHCEKIDTGRLSLSVRGMGPTLSMSDVWSNSLPPRSSIDDAEDNAQVCPSMGKLTTVTLESITEVHGEQDATVGECVEIAEASLRMPGSVPAFITDCTTRVRWVNAAFKKMLGQPEQQSRVMAMGTHMAETAAIQHDPQELTFMGAAEKIPWSAWAFSGLVNLEWMKAGKRRSMTVPCDVSRLAPAATWVWKFDLALSLSLNLCA